MGVNKMSDFTTRQPFITELKNHRNHDLLVFVTSTKQPEQHFAAQIAPDVLPIFYDIFKKSHSKDVLDLLLYSAGGLIDAPWPIVNLIREYYSDFKVIIPSKAHSAATLISLGANSVDMGPLASLSPIDPQLFITHPDKKETISAGIEDIYGYYLLIQDTLNLDSSGKTEALKLLSSRISPEILGQASRIRNEIRVIATNLLKLHMKDDKKVDSIVSSLVEKLHSHQYMISRKEAKDLGLPVTYLDSKTEQLSCDILNSYIDEVKMNEPGLDIVFGPGENSKTISLNRAFIETQNKNIVFKTEYTFYKDGRLEKKLNKWMEE